jgi:hypothetical protein
MLVILREIQHYGLEVHARVLREVNLTKCKLVAEHAYEEALLQHVMHLRDDLG